MLQPGNKFLKASFCRQKNTSKKNFRLYLSCLSCIYNMFDWSDKNSYLPAPDPQIAISQDWYPDSTLYGFDHKGEDWNVIVIGNAKDHPLDVPFRVVWDFDHIQIRAGALSRVSTDDLSRFQEALKMKKRILYAEANYQAIVQENGYFVDIKGSEKGLETALSMKNDTFP